MLLLYTGIGVTDCNKSLFAYINMYVWAEITSDLDFCCVNYIYMEVLIGTRNLLFDI